MTPEERAAFQKGDLLASGVTTGSVTPAHVPRTTGSARAGQGVQMTWHHPHPPHLGPCWCGQQQPCCCWPQRQNSLIQLTVFNLMLFLSVLCLDGLAAKCHPVSVENFNQFWLLHFIDS